MEAPTGSLYKFDCNTMTGDACIRINMPTERGATKRELHASLNATSLTKPQYNISANARRMYLGSMGLEIPIARPSESPPQLLTPA